MPNVMQEVISQADASCAAYGVNSFYNNRFIQNDGFPVEFSDGQRVTIITSAEVTTMGVKSNTLNGIEIYRILKPLTRYELIYCVDHFEVVEG